LFRQSRRAPHGGFAKPISHSPIANRPAFSPGGSLFVLLESYCAQKERKGEAESFILFFVRDAESRDPYKKVKQLATAN